MSKKLDLKVSINCTYLKDFESRYVIGSIPKEVYYKHKLFAAEHINGQIEIVCYRIKKPKGKNDKENS